MKHSILKLSILISILTLGCKKERFEPEVNFPAAYIVNGEDNSVSVLALSDNEVKTSIELKKADWPHHISMSPDKKKLAIAIPGMDLSAGHGGSGGHSGMGSGRILIVDAETGKICDRIALKTMNHNAAYSPDGSEIWTSQMDMEGKVIVMDSKKFKEKNIIDVGSMPAEVTFSQDGSTAFVANGGSNSVTAIRVSDKSVIATIPVGANPVGAWKASNNKMYVDNEDGKSISVINVSSLSVEETITLGFTPAMAAYNSKLNELWVTDTENGKLVYFQQVNGSWANAGSIETGAGAHAVVFSNDENTAYITNQNAGTVSIIDVNSKTKMKDVSVGSKPNGILLRY